MKHPDNQPPITQTGQKWISDALRENLPDLITTTPNITCSDWVDYPLFMVMRWDINNVYHIHEDFLQTYLGYSVMDLDADDTELIFLDNDPDVSNKRANAIWKSVFSRRSNKKVGNSLDTIRTLRDLANATTPGARYLCLRSATFGLHAGLTTLSRQVAVSTECPSSPVLRAFADFMLTRLGLPPVYDTIPNEPTASATSILSISQYALSSDLRDAEITPLLERFPFTNLSEPPLIITFSSRVATVKGPVERQITNEKALLSAMLTAIREKFQKEHITKPFIFRRIDFAKVHLIREQIAILRESDVLVGAHGAAFVYSLYMPRWGGVVELQHPSRMYNFHFENIAKLTGREYSVLPIGDPVMNINDVVAQTVNIVAKVLTKRAQVEGGN
ncbi:hypothetical protein BC936DRAFT_149163 [Jimgerdemannia flammicorona]|nr:hypothetical protein BC936DRAFT_149163 [Jimgerdemannia flammicorona]